jgi:gliding motility-associated-like protein
VTDPSWNNQSNLRFRIRWVNNASSTPDPPLAIDHVVITGDLTTMTSACPATVQECFTITTTNRTNPTFTQIDPFCEGTAAPTLPLSSTNTPTITGTWNAPVSNTAGSTIYTFTPATTECANTGTMEIVVKPNPNVSVNPFDTSLCLNTTIQLTATGADSYVWSPSGDLSSATGNSVTYNAISHGNKVYNVIGTTNGCSDSANVQLLVNSLPIITLTADRINGCEPLTVEFTLTSSPTSPSISWDFGDGINVINSPATTTYNNAGIYSVFVSVVDVNGCTNSYLANNYITVYPTPIVDFTMSGDFANIGELVGFNSSNISSGMTYEWSFGDGFYETSNAATSHSYSSSGQFVIEHAITSEYGCKDSISKPIDIIRPIKVPNIITPNNDGFNDYMVFEGLEGYEGSKVQVYNRWGTLIYVSEDYKNNWDGENHSDGTYFFILTLNEKYKIKPYHGTMTILK